MGKSKGSGREPAPGSGTGDTEGSTRPEDPGVPLPRRDRALELLLESQRGWADELVVFSTRPVPELERAVAELDREFRRHRKDWDPFLRRPIPEGFPYRTGPLRLLWEHEMFLTSLKELRAFVRPLRVEDHAGHRW